MSDADTAVAPLRVVIADDQTLVRSGFRLILNEAGITVAAEAANGQEAVAAVLAHRPDVVHSFVHTCGKAGLVLRKWAGALDRNGGSVVE